MTWAKVLSGEIHIDHRRPCASFDLTDDGQRKVCCHYTNLQPMWAGENFRKSSTFGGVRFDKRLRESEAFDVVLLLAL